MIITITGLFTIDTAWLSLVSFFCRKLLQGGARPDAFHFLSAVKGFPFLHTESLPPLGPVLDLTDLPPQHCDWLWGHPRETRNPGSFWKWKSQHSLRREATELAVDSTACSRPHYLPRAPWQMSVRVAPPIMNWGSAQISWKQMHRAWSAQWTGASVLSGCFKPLLLMLLSSEERFIVRPPC